MAWTIWRLLLVAADLALLHQIFDLHVCLNSHFYGIKTDLLSMMAATRARFRASCVMLLHMIPDNLPPKQTIFKRLVLAFL